jgi:hypothetical protein
VLYFALLRCTVSTLLEERREEKREEQEQVRNTYTYICVVEVQKLKKCNYSTLKIERIEVNKRNEINIT